jgi:hypothetical protein
MSKRLGVLVAFILALVGPAGAETLSYDFAFVTQFSDPSVAWLELPVGSLVEGMASFDSSLIDPATARAQLTGAPGESFSLSFGPLFTFGPGDDLFGGPVILVTASLQFQGLLFDTVVQDPSSPSQYDLTFGGNFFQLSTPGGFVMVGALGPVGGLVPGPPTGALLLAGIGLLGVYARRRQS